MGYAYHLLQGLFLNNWFSLACIGILLVCVGGCKDSEKPADETPDASEIQKEPVTQIEAFKPSAKCLAVPGVIKTWRAYEPELEWEAVLTLAELSRLAYEAKQTRINVCQEMGFEATEPLDSFSKHGFITTKDDYVVISFRGTDGAFDWLTNFHFTQKSDINRRKGIHKGFQSSYAKFRDKIRLHLADDKTKVWITGHSLGGAMAACCAYDLVSQGAQIDGLVTFGQPRIGNKKLAEFLDEKLGDRYLRLMNEDDPVPLLPPSIGGILPAYWHCGKRIKFFGNEIVTSEGVLPMALPAFEAIGNSSDSTTVKASPVCRWLCVRI